MAPHCHRAPLLIYFLEGLPPLLPFFHIYKIAGAQQKKSGVASSCRGSVECGRPAAAAALSSEWQKEKEKHIQNFEIEEEESKLFKEILFFFYFVFLLTPETIVCASIRK